MTKTWVKVRDFLPMAAILLLCMLVMPATQAYANTNPDNGTATTATASQQEQQVKVAADQQTAPGKAKKATVTKPREKSVLDAEVLESPLAYFRDAFSSEEEESDTATGNSAVVVTLKTLIATLLSTVI